MQHVTKSTITYIRGSLIVLVHPRTEKKQKTNIIRENVQNAIQRH